MTGNLRNDVDSHNNVTIYEQLDSFHCLDLYLGYKAGKAAATDRTAVRLEYVEP